MKKSFEVGFKVTFEGIITVDAETVQAAAAMVKEHMGVNCCLDGEDALEVQSYTYVHSVTEDDE